MNFSEANALPFDSVWSVLHHTSCPALNKEFKSEIRPDNKAGCWISRYNGKEYYNDRAEYPKPLSVVDYTAVALGLNPSYEQDAQTALKFLEEKFDPCGSYNKSYRKPKPILPPPPEPLPSDSYAGDLRELTDAELQQICNARGMEVSIDGLKLMREQSMLLRGKAYGEDVYAITDVDRKSLDFRLLRGGRFSGGQKTKGAYKLCHKHPLGISNMVEGNYTLVMVVEGSGDFMTAHRFIMSEGRNIDRPNYPKVCAVAVLSASQDVPVEYIQSFAGRTVCFYPHIDKSCAGQKAVARWQRQLQPVVSETQVFSFEGLKKEDGEPVCDLGDFAAIPYHKVAHEVGMTCPISLKGKGGTPNVTALPESAESSNPNTFNYA